MKFFQRNLLKAKKIGVTKVVFVAHARLPLHVHTVDPCRLKNNQHKIESLLFFFAPFTLRHDQQVTLRAESPSIFLDKSGRGRRLS